VAVLFDFCRNTSCSIFY